MNKNNLIEYLMKGFLHTLIVGGLCQSIFVSLYLPISFLATLSMVFLLYMVLTLYLKSKWHLIFMTPAALVLVWVYISLFSPEEWWLGLQAWLNWMGYYPIGLALLEPGYVYPSAWVVAAVLSTIFYVLDIKLHYFVPPLILGIGILALEWTLGHSNIIPFIWPFALGMILLYAGKNHQQLSSRFATPTYGLWQLSALPIAVIILFTAFIVMPGNTRSLKWDSFEKGIHDLTEDWSDWFGFSSPRQPFRLSETGFPSSPDALGGPVHLSRDVVMEVTSPYPLYLRGTILNTYTSRGWKDTIADKRYKAKDQYWRGVLNTAFDMDEPLWSDLTDEQRQQFFSTFKIEILHTGIETSVLFNVLQSKDFEPSTGREFVPYFNGKGETFTTRYLNKDEPYTMDVRIPNLHLKEFQEFINSYVPVIDWQSSLPEEVLEDKQYGQKLLNIQENYTKNPPNLPQRVIDLAHEITKDAATPFEKAVALQNYLQNHYAYTLSPPYTPVDQDFVDHFLFDLQSGYCTYFASSMAVMGRAVGLPTRYIEGFAMPLEYELGSRYKVRKYNGHAWVEVYFPKIGWLTFDPTPLGVGHDGPGAGGYIDGNIPNWEEFMNPYQDYEWDNSNLEQYMPKPKKQIPWQTRVSKAIILPIILLSIIGILLGAVLLWYKLRWIGVNRQPFLIQLRTYYREILWLFTLYNCPIRRGETPYSYAERVDHWLVSPVGSMMDISQLLIKSEFGSYELKEEDIEKIKDFHDDLEKNVGGIMSYPRYLVILLLRHINKRVIGRRKKDL